VIVIANEKAIEIGETDRGIEIETARGKEIGTGTIDTADTRTTPRDNQPEISKKQYLRRTFPKKRLSDWNRKL
jgi:hypothetical protein